MADGDFSTFLRKLGAGLNPQVAAALESENRLAQQQQQFDVTRQDRASEAQASRKEKLAAFLGTSLAKIDRTDPRNAEIVQSLESGIDQLGEEYAPYKSVGAPASELKDKKAENLISLISPDGAERRSFRKGDKRIDALIDKKWVEAPARQEQGKVGAFEKKLHEELTQEDISLRQGVGALENLKGIITSDNYVGGVTGDVIQNVVSGAAQVRQIFGDDSVTDEAGIKQADLSGLSNTGMDRLRKAAGESAELQSAITELAYIHAKSLDPGGRISDKDVDAAIRMIGKNADKAVSLKLFNAMQERIVRNANISKHSRWKAEQAKLPPEKRGKFSGVTVKGILDENVKAGAVKRTETDNFVDDMFNELMNNPAGN